MAAEMCISSGDSTNFSHSETLLAVDEVLLTVAYFLLLHVGPSHQCLHPLAESKWGRADNFSHSNRFRDHQT